MIDFFKTVIFLNLNSPTLLPNEGLKNNEMGRSRTMNKRNEKTGVSDTCK